MIYIVLPAYNEGENIHSLLDAVAYNMGLFGYEYKVLVVNDGSTDDTGKTVESLTRTMPVELLNNAQNMGLGETLKKGVYYCVNKSEDRDIIITMDADNTHTPGLILRMVRAILEGNDVVIASRYKPDARVKGVSLSRRALSKGASLLFQLTYPIKGVKDYTSGYRAYKAKCLKDALSLHGEEFIDQAGFSCMVDILLKLRKMDLLMNEVPLILRYDAKIGASKMKIFKTIYNTLSVLTKGYFVYGKKTRGVPKLEKILGK